MSTRSNLHTKLGRQSKGDYLKAGLKVASQPGYQPKGPRLIVRSERELSNRIATLDIRVGRWVLIKGEAIRRKVEAVTADFRLQLQGFSGVTFCPFDVTAVFDTAK